MAANSSQPTGQWLEIDFGGERTFNRSRIVECIDWGQRINDYESQYWNGSQWLSAFSGSVPSGSQVDSFAPVTGTKARLFIATVHADFPTIWEFGVFHQQEHSIGTIPNTGSYDWTVPGDTPDSIMLELASDASTDKSGLIHIVDVASTAPDGEFDNALKSFSFSQCCCHFFSNS